MFYVCKINQKSEESSKKQVSWSNWRKALFQSCSSHFSLSWSSPRFYTPSRCHFPLCRPSRSAHSRTFCSTTSLRTADTLTKSRAEFIFPRFCWWVGNVWVATRTSSKIWECSEWNFLNKKILSCSQKAPPFRINWTQWRKPIYRPDLTNRLSAWLIRSQNCCCYWL